MDPQPSLADTVIYSRPAEGPIDAMDCAAIVTDVEDAEEGVVKLTVFRPSAAPEMIAMVPYDEEDVDHTWRWPEHARHDAPAG